MADITTDVNNIINEVGEWITYRTGSASYNDYGDGSVTWVTGSAIGHIQPVTEEESSLTGGILSPGDAIGFFKSGLDITPQPGSESIEFQFNSNWYEQLGRPVTHFFSGALTHQEISLRRKVI